MRNKELLKHKLKNKIKRTRSVHINDMMQSTLNISMKPIFENASSQRKTIVQYFNSGKKGLFTCKPTVQLKIIYHNK